MTPQQHRRVEPGYCPRCGGELAWRRSPDDDRDRRACESCGAIDYRQPKVAAGVIILRHGRLLLTRRAIDPYRGLWCLPAGFIEEDEGSIDCAVRETREETGLDIEIDRVFGVYDYTDDPRGRGILIIYEAHAVGGAERAGDDAAETAWFGLDAIDDGNIAFSQHRQALRDLRSRAIGGGGTGDRDHHGRGDGQPQGEVANGARA